MISPTITPTTKIVKSQKKKTKQEWVLFCGCWDRTPKITDRAEICSTVVLRWIPTKGLLYSGKQISIRVFAFGLGLGLGLGLPVRVSKGFGFPFPPDFRNFPFFEALCPQAARGTLFLTRIFPRRPNFRIFHIPIWRPAMTMPLVLYLRSCVRSAR